MKMKITIGIAVWAVLILLLGMRLGDDIAAKEQLKKMKPFRSEHKSAPRVFRVLPAHINPAWVIA